MKFKYKLVLYIVLLGSIVLLIGGFSYYTITKSSLTEQMLESDSESTIFISETIQNDLLDLVRSTKILASTNIIKDSLVVSNEEFYLMDMNNRSDYIDELNNQWIDTDDIEDPFIKTRMENDVALFLLSQQNDYPELYGEIFLTNEYGVMISTTGKLSTLAHAEKYWWVESYNNGDGIVYIDDRGFDSSVDGYVVGIVVPVYDDSNNVIGILKCNYNIASIFEDSVVKFHDLNSEGEMYVARTLGLIINGGEFEPLTQSVSDDILPYLEEKTNISKAIIIDGEDSFLTISPIDLTFDSDEISFGGKYESIDHSLGNLDEGWSILHINSEEVALKELSNTMTVLLTVSFGLLFLIAVSAVIIGDTLSKPFVRLNDYIGEVSKGKLVKREMKISNDEIGELTTSFNKLIENLSSTLTSKENLEKEIDEKEKVKQVLQISESKYKSLVTNMSQGLALHEMIFDDSGKPVDYTYLDINESYTKLLGITREMCIGKRVLEVIPSLEDYWIQAFGRVVITGESNYYENYLKETGKYYATYTYSPKEGQFAVMVSDITERINREKEIEFLSYHDLLTGLYNRRFFEEEMKRLDNPRNYPISIAMGDVNGLKLTNDAFGHHAGDKLLKMIGEHLSSSVRGNDITARWGGDEFVILLPNTDSKAAQIMIDRIQKKIKNVSFEFGKPSISFGWDTKTDKKEDINRIFTSAEELMYQNKLTEIKSIRGETINTIITTLFEKSAEVKEHSERVSKFATLIAEEMGLAKGIINDIKIMGVIHDIGKIVVDLHIINKQGKLNDEEIKIIQQHPLSGSRMLNSSHEYKRLALGVLHHHERIDGKGYPNGICGDQIPLESKIISVADAFDAMTAQRPYRLTPLSNEEAIAELRKHSGTQFDKKVVDIFVEKVLKDYK